LVRPQLLPSGPEIPAREEEEPAPFAAPAPSPEEGQLLVTLITGEEQLPLGDTRLVVYDPMGSSGTEVRAGRWSQTTDADGRATFGLPLGQALRLKVRRDSAGQEAPTIDVPAFSPGERRAITVQLGQLREAVFEGYFLDATDDKPIAGAEVRLRPWSKTHSSADLLDHSGRADAVSDGAGRFELQWARTDSSFAAVHAIGYGPMFFDLAGQQGLSQSAHPIRLYRSAAYELKVDDPGPFPDLRLRVTSAGQVNARNGSSPLLAGALGWSAPVSAGGVAQILTLPPNTPLNVELWRATTRIYASSAPITLAQGEHRVFGLGTGGIPMITGTLRDESGEPASHKEIWLVPATSRNPKLLTHSMAGAHNPRRAKTDAEGRFQFVDPGSGDWWVGPAPVSSTASGAPPPLPLAKWLHFPEGSQQVRLDLTTRMGVFLEGVVRDSAGKPLHGSTLHFRPVLDAQVQQRPVDEQGRFRVGPLVPGLYDVWVAAGQAGEHQGSLPRTVRAGGQPIEFTVRRGSWVQVGAVAPGEKREARITRGLLTHLGERSTLVRDLRSSLLLVEEADGAGSQLERAVLRGNAMELSELEPGTYGAALYSADGRVAVLDRMDTAEMGSPAQAHAVLYPVGWLLLEHLGEAHGADYRVLRNKVIVANGTLGCGALIEVPVPPGELLVEWAIQGEPMRTQTVSSAPHGRVRVHF